MDDISKTFEGLKLISDWGKWLIIISAGAIAIIGWVVKMDKVPPTTPVKLLATSSIVCLLASIAAAAVLLLSLPEIAQNLQPNVNIWLTYDSVLGRTFGMNTERLAILVCLFFGLGMTCFSATVITTIWRKSASQSFARKQK